jgi:DNA-binding transcriptional MerR regulator
MNVKRKHLYIGELAQLVGVSVKTVRHYHRMGLLPEPQRSSSGYRMYTTGHVRRLRLIRQMREIGLSLSQILTAMGKADDESWLRETLQEVLDEIDEQMHELSKRRDRISALLAQSTLHNEDLNDTPSLYLEEAYRKLGHLLPHLDEGLLDQETRLEAVLSQYNWSDDLPAFFGCVISYFEVHPQQYQQFIGDLQASWHRVQAPETDDATLRALARALVEKHRAVFDQWLQMGQATPIPPSFQTVLRDMFGEVISDALQRFSHYLTDAYQRISDDRDSS